MEMEKDELLRRYLEGDLTSDEEREALHTIADDPEMRSMLRFEQKLAELFAGASYTESRDNVPEGFSDRVMSKIEQADKPSLADKIAGWYRRLWVPQQVQWRPAYGFAVVLLALVALAYPLLMIPADGLQNQQAANIQNLDNSVQQVSSDSDEVMLRFVYIDENANSVAVAGDFSNWEPVELTKQTVNGEQVWSGLVSMSRGEHNYMFVKNGDEWVTDPLAPVQRDDGFGNKNAVIYL